MDTEEKIQIRILREIGEGICQISIARVDYVKRGEEVERVIGEAEQQVWMRSSKRGVGKTCVICGKNLEGQLSYRPRGSPPNRWWRICLDDMKVGNEYYIKEPHLPVVEVE